MKASGKLSTKDAIYESALDAFAEKGYAGASLRDIAQRVGVEVASLYNHIDSKESLLFNIIMSTSEELYDVLAEARANGVGEPREALQRVLGRHILFATTHGRHSFVGTVELRALTEVHRSQALAMRGRVEDLYRELVRACIAAGYLPGRTDTTVAAFQFLALATNVSSWFKAGGTQSAEQIAAFTTDLVLNGLNSRG